MKLKKEAIIGIFVFTMLIVLYWGFNFLNKTKMMRASNTYYLVMPQTHGLVRKSPIFVSGLSIGSVSDIALRLPEGSVVATLQISSSYMLPQGSTARVIAGGLMDKKGVAITLGSADTYIAQGDTIALGQSEKDLFEAMAPIAYKADSMLIQINEIVGELHYTLKSGTQDDITMSLKNLAIISESLNQTTQGLSKIVNNNEGKINSMVSDLANSSKNLNELSTGLNKRSEEIYGIISNTDSTMATANRLAHKLEQLSNEGTMLQLMQNDTLYTSLTRTINTLDTLLRDLNEHPEDYVHFSMFGGKKKKK